MERRRSPWSAVVRLAVVVSALAVAVALALSAFGDVSQTAIVIAVIVVGFVVSWIRSGRALDDDGSDEPTGSFSGGGRRGPGGPASQRAMSQRSTSHRVAVVPLHPLRRAL